MNILFDGNYLFHKTFSVFSNYYRGEDMSLILQDKEKQQILIRKCIIDMCYAISRFKDVDKVIFVIDSSSWRHKVYDDYKYSLTRVKEPYYKHFLKVLDMLEALLRKKGVIVSRVNGAEGDDLMYIWSIYVGLSLNEDLVIITGDSDIRQIMTDKVSLFNNNSKNMKLYCVPENELFWKDYFDDDIQVVAVNPFEVLLYKVIMGDSSDNIPKLKKGFGDKAFEKFLNSIRPYSEPKECDMLSMSRWIAIRFSTYANTDYNSTLDSVLFNLKLVWLNADVYCENGYMCENGKNLLDNMLNDVIKQKGSYSYKGKYTLEDFYGMIIK